MATLYRDIIRAQPPGLDATLIWDNNIAWAQTALHAFGRVLDNAGTAPDRQDAHVRFTGERREGGQAPPIQALYWENTTYLDELVGLDSEVGRQRSQAYIAPMRNWTRRVNMHRDAIAARIALLREEAEEEDESFSQASADLLVRYCDWLSPDNQPAIFLLKNGNLRAIWQNPEKDQIGIQFFPNGDLQYVILRDRDGRTLKTMGVETAGTIRRIVGSVRLTSLWFDGQR